MAKGYKQCPKCAKANGVKASLCTSCGHKFEKKQKERAVSVSDKPGRGHKQCPKCNVYLGVKSAKCVCGHSFKKQEIALPPLPSRAPLPPKPAPKPSAGKGPGKGPGKGHKQCPKCKNCVGLRVRVCTCGYEFPPPGEKKENKVKTLNGGGRGHKQCPKCKNYVGSRSEKCTCGHEFEKKEAPKLAPLPALPATPLSDSPRLVDPRFDPRVRSVIIPAGECPVKLHSTEREEIEIWAHAIVSKGLDQNIRYEPTALRYWVRQFYDMGTPEHNEACSVILEMFATPA